MSYKCDNSDGGGASGYDSNREDDGDRPGSPNIDTIFSVLAHPRRRYALDCLLEHRKMTLADLADEVAVREHKQPLGEIPAKPVKRVYLSLYHTHVPKLESANLVGYSQPGDSVTVGEAIEPVIPFLALVNEYAKETI